jgi:hypothetical protein
VASRCAGDNSKCQFSRFDRSTNSAYAGSTHWRLDRFPQNARLKSFIVGLISAFIASPDLLYGWLSPYRAGFSFSGPVCD